MSISGEFLDKYAIESVNLSAAELADQNTAWIHEAKLFEGAEATKEGWREEFLPDKNAESLYNLYGFRMDKTSLDQLDDTMHAPFNLTIDARNIARENSGSKSAVSLDRVKEVFDKTVEADVAITTVLTLLTEWETVGAVIARDGNSALAQQIYDRAAKNLGIPILDRVGSFKRAFTNSHPRLAYNFGEYFLKMGAQHPGGAGAMVDDISRQRVGYEMKAIQMSTVKTAAILQGFEAPVSRHADAIKMLLKVNSDQLLTDQINSQDKLLIASATLLKKYHGMVPAKLQEMYDSAVQTTDAVLRMRGYNKASIVNGERHALINRVPLDRVMVNEYHEGPWQARKPTEPIVIKREIDPVAVEAAREQARAKALIEQAAKKALQEQQASYNAPILEQLATLKTEHEAALSVFNPSKKAMRQDGIVGADSLEFALKDMAGTNIGFEDYLKTYKGLLDLARQHGSEITKVYDQLVAGYESRLVGYNAVRDQLVDTPLGSLKLNGDFRPQIEWIARNWSTIQEATKGSKHNLSAQELQTLSAFMDYIYGNKAVAAVETEAIAEIIEDTPIIDLEPVTESEPEPESIMEDEPAVEVPVEAEVALDGLALPLKESDVALQLDWEVFPPDIKLDTIKQRTREGFKNRDTKNIEWERISDLLEISRTFNGEVYRSKPGSLGTKLPYFVAIVTVDGKEYAIGENAQYGNASYVLRTDLAEYGYDWRTVFEQPRALARLLGAEQVVHTAERKHLDRIMDVIQSQHLIRKA